MTQEPTTQPNNNKASAIDHDRIFKELLAVFFLEFLKLFFPKMLEYLEPGSLVALDKEVFTDVTAGDKHEVDLIMRASFKSIPTKPKRGNNTVVTKEEKVQPTAYFLIHVEAQSTNRTDFPRRMFIYFSRLIEKYNQPVYPIVVFSFDSPEKQVANTYQVDFPDLDVLKFKYAAIQLNQLDWKKFVNNPNPVASALMAKMKIAPKDRPIVKLECLKMLTGLKLDPAKTQLITGFINTYLKLDQEEKQVFEAALKKLEPTEQKEQVMQVMNEWIEEGIERGIEQGIEQGIERGRHEERLDLILRQLNRKVHQILPTEIEKQVSRLSDMQLVALADALLEFNTLTDLTEWLRNNTSN